ncbi:MAG: glycoside hydrolase family 65 protein [Chloroflexi bacterium]|nr:glycoside hydrolase family 65 protein [Chloroflexota bacterium]
MGLAPLFEPPVEPLWRLDQPGYEPALERDVEARFAVSNGFLGVRASLEQPTTASRPRTFIAGLFNVDPEGSGPPFLAPGPDWVRIAPRIDGETPSLSSEQTLSFKRTLDLRRGLLLSEWTCRGAAGPGFRLQTLRLVSLAHRGLAIQLARLDVFQDTAVTLEAWLEPPEPGLVALPVQAPLHLWRTRDGLGQLAVASVMDCRVGGRSLASQADANGLRRTWHGPAGPRRSALFQRTVAFARGSAGHAPTDAAIGSLKAARRAGARGRLAAHVHAWERRWAASDVVVEGDEASQRALRFALYHLNSAADPDDERVSIGARALTGDAYQGHVFWDTEIFLLPFYSLTWPRAARAMLMYRYHTLPAAREKAARLGYRGALFAWESAATGAEVTPTQAIGPDGQVIPIRCGIDEQHISADVAYAVWQYWQATGDGAFLRQAGAEIILETARFWASRATLEDDGRFHIRGVIGPDEYHEGVDDNAYTNVMAQWNLERGLEVAQLPRRRWPRRWAELRAQLQLTDGELSHWRAVAQGLATDRVDGPEVLEQFAGFSGLEAVDLTAYVDRAVPMDVLLGRERTSRSQVIKQADVLMLLALLPERFNPAEAMASFRYYEPRCGHGSSLSPAVHALVAARLGLLDRAMAYVHQASAIDLSDGRGNAAHGIHIGAQGGLWQAAVFGFAGMRLDSDRLRFDPRLPPEWAALRFSVQWRQRALGIEIDRASGTLTASLRHGRPMKLSIGDCDHVLSVQQPVVQQLDEGRFDREG